MDESAKPAAYPMLERLLRGRRRHPLARRLVEAQEAERGRIARELHDGVVQTLTAMRINLDIVRARLSKHEDPIVRERNDDSFELVESAFRSVQALMQDLRPPMLDDDGLVASLQWYGRKFAQRTGIAVEVRGQDDCRLDPEGGLALFRIGQEALTRVARHALARSIAIEISVGARQIRLVIEADGIGLDDEDEWVERTGYGFLTLRERSEAIGGSFAIVSEEGKGTRITVTVPRP